MIALFANQPNLTCFSCYLYSILLEVAHNVGTSLPSVDRGCWLHCKGLKHSLLQMAQTFTILWRAKAVCYRGSRQLLFVTVLCCLMFVALRRGQAFTVLHRVKVVCFSASNKFPFVTLVMGLLQSFTKLLSLVWIRALVICYYERLRSLLTSWPR